MVVNRSNVNKPNGTINNQRRNNSLMNNHIKQTESNKNNVCNYPKNGKLNCNNIKKQDRTQSQSKSNESHKEKKLHQEDNESEDFTKVSALTFDTSIDKMTLLKTVETLKRLSMENNTNSVSNADQPVIDNLKNILSGLNQKYENPEAIAQEVNNVNNNHTSNSKNYSYKNFKDINNIHNGFEKKHFKNNNLCMTTSNSKSPVAVSYKINDKSLSSNQSDRSTSHKFFRWIESKTRKFRKSTSNSSGSMDLQSNHRKKSSIFFCFTISNKKKQVYKSSVTKGDDGEFSAGINKNSPKSTDLPNLITEPNPQTTVEIDEKLKDSQRLLFNLVEHCSSLSHSIRSLKSEIQKESTKKMDKTESSQISLGSLSHLINTEKVGSLEHFSQELAEALKYCFDKADSLKESSVNRSCKTFSINNKKQILDRQHPSQITLNSKSENMLTYKEVSECLTHDINPKILNIINAALHAKFKSISKTPIRTYNKNSQIKAYLEPEASMSSEVTENDANTCLLLSETDLCKLASVVKHNSNDHGHGKHNLGNQNINSKTNERQRHHNQPNQQRHGFIQDAYSENSIVSDISKKRKKSSSNKNSRSNSNHSKSSKNKNDSMSESTLKNDSNDYPANQKYHKIENGKKATVLNSSKNSSSKQNLILAPPRRRRHDLVVTDGRGDLPQEGQIEKQWDCSQIDVTSFTERTSSLTNYTGGASACTLAEAGPSPMPISEDGDCQSVDYFHNKAIYGRAMNSNQNNRNGDDSGDDSDDFCMINDYSDAQPSLDNTPQDINASSNRIKAAAKTSLKMMLNRMEKMILKHIQCISSIDEQNIDHSMYFNPESLFDYKIDVEDDGMFERPNPIFGSNQNNNDDKNGIDKGNYNNSKIITRNSQTSFCQSINKGVSALQQTVATKQNLEGCNKIKRRPIWSHFEMSEEFKSGICENYSEPNIKSNVPTVNENDIISTELDEISDGLDEYALIDFGSNTNNDNVSPNAKNFRRKSMQNFQESEENKALLGYNKEEQNYSKQVDRVRQMVQLKREIENEKTKNMLSNAIEKKRIQPQAHPQNSMQLKETLFCDPIERPVTNNEKKNHSVDCPMSKQKRFPKPKWHKDTPPSFTKVIQKSDGDSPIEDEYDHTFYNNSNSQNSNNRKIDNDTFHLPPSYKAYLDEKERQRKLKEDAEVAAAVVEAAMKPIGSTAGPSGTNQSLHSHTTNDSNNASDLTRLFMHMQGISTKLDTLAHSVEDLTSRFNQIENNYRLHQASTALNTNICTPINNSMNPVTHSMRTASAQLISPMTTSYSDPQWDLHQDQQQREMRLRQIEQEQHQEQVIQRQLQQRQRIKIQEEEEAVLQMQRFRQQQLVTQQQREQQQQRQFFQQEQEIHQSNLNQQRQVMINQNDQMRAAYVRELNGTMTPFTTAGNTFVSESTLLREPQTPVPNLNNTQTSLPLLRRPISITVPPYPYDLTTATALGKAHREATAANKFIPVEQNGCNAKRSVYGRLQQSDAMQNTAEHTKGNN